MLRLQRRIARVRQRQTGGNIGPASEGTELVQVGTADNAYKCTVTVADKEQDWALCLTDPKYAKKNGTQLILATCRNTANQHWSVP